MKLSVIIPCFNAADTIGVQLKALANQTWTDAWEIIVSDNGSTDDTLNIVRTFSRRLPNLRMVDSSGRKGPAHARNVAAQAATGTMLAFCDADDEVAPGWVSAISSALSEHDFVASRWDTEKLNSSLAQKYNGNPQKHGYQLLWYPPYLPHSGACGLGVKRSLHDIVGGFDESLPRLMDTDYCIKLQLAGVKLHFVPQALVHIRHRENLKGIIFQARLWAKYNTLLYKRYRQNGMKIPGAWAQYLKDWYGIVIRIPHLMNKTSRGRWVYKFAWQIGLLEGSLTYWVAPPVVGKRKYLIRDS